MKVLVPGQRHGLVLALGTGDGTFLLSTALPLRANAWLRPVPLAQGAPRSRLALLTCIKRAAGAEAAGGEPVGTPHCFSWCNALPQSQAFPDRAWAFLHKG